MDGRQRRARQQDQPLLRHRHDLQRQRTLDRNRRRRRRQRSRHVRLEHCRRGAGHVLYRRLPVRRRQDLHLLPPRPRRSPSPPAPPQTFAVSGPTSGSYPAGQSVNIPWSADSVVAGSKISLCYDTDTTFNGNEHWIEIDGVAAANGSASLHVGHDGRGAGHVLPRRLHVRRQGNLHHLASEPGNHHHRPGGGARPSPSAAQPPARIRRARRSASPGRPAASSPAARSASATTPTPPSTATNTGSRSTAWRPPTAAARTPGTPPA